MNINKSIIKPLALWIAFIAPFIFASDAFAADGVGQVQSFIESLIKVASLLGGGIAVFFVIVGGYRYVTSTNDPEKLEHAKGTLIHAGIGLAIVIGANVLISIVTDLATSAFGK